VIVNEEIQGINGRKFKFKIIGGVLFSGWLAVVHLLVACI
jgi:hypothetical protein